MKISKFLHQHISTNTPLMESELRVGSDRWLEMIKEYRQLCKIKPEYKTKANAFLLDEEVGEPIVYEKQNRGLKIPYPIYDSPNGERLYEVLVREKNKVRAVQFTENLDNLIDLKLEHEYFQKKDLNETVSYENWLGEKYIQCDKISEVEYKPNLNGGYALKIESAFTAPKNFAITEGIRGDLAGRGYDSIFLNESYFIFSPLQVCPVIKSINESSKHFRLKLTLEKYSIDIV